MLPDLPPLPALTRAEGELIDRYLEAVDLLGRVNPARHGTAYGALRAAQGLVRKAAELRDALALMHQRGETELHGDTLARALRVLDGERRAARVALPPDGVGRGGHPSGPAAPTRRHASCGPELKRPERRTADRCTSRSFSGPPELRDTPVHGSPAGHITPGPGLRRRSDGASNRAPSTRTGEW
jgi:hypothetical protein